MQKKTPTDKYLHTLSNSQARLIFSSLWCKSAMISEIGKIQIL